MNNLTRSILVEEKHEQGLFLMRDLLDCETQNGRATEVVALCCHQVKK